MSCVHPIRCWSRKGIKPRKLVFSPPSLLEQSLYEELQIPCGQCIGCRLDYSRDWATRIYHESLSWKDNWFVTLTYSPEYVPVKSAICLETGELIQGFSLYPRDLQLFMKRLRKYWKDHFDHDNIRFYACGEYGSQTERPHYHLCLFNLPMPDGALEYFFSNKLGDPIYLCPIIEKIWSKGQISVGSVTWQSAAYVARYMLKKHKGSDVKWFYDSQAKEPEFTRMSRKPGIGRDWYEQHKNDLYDKDHCIIPSRDFPLVVRPPRYYDRLFDLDSPEAMEAIKARRMARALEAEKVACSVSSLSQTERLEARERRLQDSTKSLIRSFENQT